MATITFRAMFQCTRVGIYTAKDDGLMQYAGVDRAICKHMHKHMYIFRVYPIYCLISSSSIGRIPKFRSSCVCMQVNGWLYV